MATVMTMTNFKKSGLNALLRQMEIGVVNIYYGIRALNLKFSYPHFRLLFVLESDGKSSFSDDYQKAYCRPGDWFLIPPFCEITHDLNDTMHHLSIHFTATLGQSVSLVQPRNSFLTMTDQTARNRIIHTINSEPELAQCLLFRELCYNKLGEYVTQEDSTMILQLLRTPGYATLLEFLNTTATAKTGIDDMAAQCNLSRNAFVKRFKRDFGVPPGKFLAKILTSHAIAKLSPSGKTIKETAEELGFSNAFVFSRFFHTQTGLSPRKFQKKMPQIY